MARTKNAPEEPVRIARLIERHRRYGRSDAEAHDRAHGSDQVKAARIQATADRADRWVSCYPHLVSLNDDRMADWVVEKLGIVLGDLARIADIAKDPETPQWYRRRLRSSLHSAFGNALKVLLHALDRLDDWRPDLALTPTEHGTMGLAAQLGSMGIDHQLNVGEPFGDLDDDEPEDARWPTTPDKVPEASEEPWSSSARQHIMAASLTHLADRSMPEVERRALAWIAYHLTMSDHPDVAFLLPGFFARDIGVSEEEAQAVLVSLTEKRLIYRETRLDDARRMAIKLIIHGLNDPRHEPAAN